MHFAFAGLVLVFVVLWRLAVSGRARWIERARYWEGATSEAIEAWGARCEELQARVQYLEQSAAGPLVYERDRARELRDQSEVQLIDARRGRDEAWRARDQMMERTRDLQERLTASEARSTAPVCACGCAPACVSPRACAIVREGEAEIRADERERCAAVAARCNPSTFPINVAAEIRRTGGRLCCPDPDCNTVVPVAPTDPGNPV
jgi:hypothetical protein